MSEGAGEGGLWTSSQRAVLACAVLALCAVLGARLWVNGRSIDDPPGEGALAGQLADRVDANVASWEELAAIPELGEKNAKEIVAYRQRFVADGRGDKAFRRAEDLLRVRGIGVGLVEKLEPYLGFEARGPSSR